MKFDQFWSILTKNLSENETYYTLSQKKPFKIRFDDEFVIVSPELSDSENPERRISVEEFSKIWDVSLTLSPEERFVSSKYKSVISTNKSYILSLIEYSFWH